MGLADWMRRWPSRPSWTGTTGPPRSGNGASSFHLFWDVPASLAPHGWVGAEVTLEVIDPPTVAKLYFWALQVSFASPSGSSGAHLGLQRFAVHPGGTAVNWGGYGPDGRELDGTVSALASRPGNVNTRDYPWIARRPYRLRISRVPRRLGGLDDRLDGHGLTAWRGEVQDLTANVTTVVRDLWAAGDHLAAPMVWSEVFADCDDPGATVRWSDLALVDDSGRRTPVRSVRVNYQARDEGGCAATNSDVDGDGFIQATGAARLVTAGATLGLRL
jgi:hypothetical protein